MNKTSFDAFSDELRAIQLADKDTPADYLETRAAVMTKLGFSFSPGRALVSGAKKLVGPASGVGKFLGQHGGAVEHGLDIGGLGMLAKHPIQDLNSKDQDVKSRAKWELGGLGTLAVAPAARLGQHILSRH
jgi:hypothetical protein